MSESQALTQLQETRAKKRKWEDIRDGDFDEGEEMKESRDETELIS
jgi:hypothetical protein